MADSTNDHPEPKFSDPETALGGADAVEKTTYVVGQGTDPNALSPVGKPAPVGKNGINPVVWGVVALIVLIAVIYVFGAFRR
ncbi:MAG TPA: hypothetical protein VIG47_16540 [Gemmatimonadaceae bacterium]|jgi:hypothetical protein